MARCMILDDSSVIRKVARRIMEDFGCHVVDAENAREALELCRLDIPDAIIIDWTMPDMSGLDFIIEFKKLFGQSSPNVCLVYCTSEMDIPAMAKAKRAGATHFFMKPFDQRILQKKLVEIGIYPVDRAA